MFTFWRIKKKGYEVIANVCVFDATAKSANIKDNVQTFVDLHVFRIFC